MNSLQDAGEFIRDIYRKRLIIIQLARQDFHNRYIGSTLGFIWTFIQPLVMTLILWFVISLALKTAAVHGIPFVLWLLVGLAAWNFFSESMSMSTSVFQEYSFLVKKVNFKIGVLPLVKILSSLAVHGVFLLIVMVVLLMNHIPPSFYWFQALYYILALVTLLLGVSWITSSLNVFVKDVAYLVNILLQFGFWLTPVFWDIGMIGPYQRYSIVLKLNPLFYIVDGYRRSFLYHTPFWVDTAWTLYFWLFAVLMLFFGVTLFRKLKPHFADVL